MKRTRDCELLNELKVVRVSVEKLPTPVIGEMRKLIYIILYWKSILGKYGKRAGFKYLLIFQQIFLDHNVPIQEVF